MADKVTLTTLKQRKTDGRPIAMVTCYDFASAVLAERSGVDSILVGDSLAQVVLGHETTLPATMEIMLALTAAVRRGASRAYLVGDMPFMSYQASREQALINAGRFLAEAGCDAVKLEVHRGQASLVEALAGAGIPVMAHLGYRPQTVHQSGDARTHGRAAQEALAVVADAETMVASGASLVLLECVPAVVGQAVTERVGVPVISCGSGPYCDGQVLVWHDLLGLPGASGARFTRAYGPIGEQIEAGLRRYVADVQARQFPDAEHSYGMESGEDAVFAQYLQAMKPPVNP